MLAVRHVGGRGCEHGGGHQGEEVAGRRGRGWCFVRVRARDEEEGEGCMGNVNGNASANEGGNASGW